MKIKKTLYENLVDSAAILTVATPIMAGLEKIAGYSTEASKNARGVAALIGISGYFYIISKGSDITDKKLNLKSKNLQKRLYFAAAGLLSFPLIYLPAKYITQALGMPPPKNLSTLTNVACAAAVGFFAGDIMKYSLDTFRDLAGIKESSNYFPTQRIKKFPGTIKKGIALAIGLSSILLTESIYKLSDYMQRNNKNSEIKENYEKPYSLEELLIKKKS